MMKRENDLAFLPATELKKLITEKQVSPVEITKCFIERIEELDPRFNSFLTTTFETAMETAKSAEQAVMNSAPLGMLHGIPISVKDLEMTAGVRTTGGSHYFRDRVPEIDSCVVQRLKKAGAVILGKTNTPEFGLLGETRNRLGDHCRNPWDTSRTSGGSSGGAGVALAAGLCSLATGSDGGGSIRIPSSFCGVYGIKPTLGRVPRTPGAEPPVANQTSQPGPMSRTVWDSALMLQVIAGHDPGDPVSMRAQVPDYFAAADIDVKGLRIGWSSDFGYAPVDAEVRRICEKAARVFDECGCIVEESDLKLESPFDAFWVLFSSNAYAAYHALLDNHADQLSDYTLLSMEFGARSSAADYSRALATVDSLKLEFASQFDKYDLILSPTMAVPPFPCGESPGIIGGCEVHPLWGYLPFTYPVNLIGHPAASIPAGFTAGGLPVGLHIIGKSGDEETVIAASAAFEEARPWSQHKPPFC